MRSSNPAFRDSMFDSYAGYASGSTTMTVEGTTVKTGVLLLFAAAGAIFTWDKFLANPASAMPWIFGGAISALIFALVTSFKPSWAAVTAPIYALLEGLFLGGISAYYDMRFNGLVMQAICLTFGTLFVMLFAYRTGVIKVTQKLRAGIFAATGGIMMIYVFSWILGFFGITIPGIFGNGAIGVGFSVVVVGIAAFNLLLDFDSIDRGAQMGAPKFMEWYCAFGLMVTLVWLYLEILRLLSKLQSRD